MTVPRVERGLGLGLGWASYWLGGWDAAVVDGGGGGVWEAWVEQGVGGQLFCVEEEEGHGKVRLA